MCICKQLFSIITRFCILCLIAGLLACSDTDSKSRDFESSQLDATVELEVDVSTKRAMARGYVGGTTTEDVVPVDETTDGTIRLVDGDRFSIAWDGQTHQLYRRSRQFVYEASFDLPASRNLNVSLGIDTIDGFQQYQVPVLLPEIASFQVLETEQTVAVGSSINLSWNLGFNQSEDADNEAMGSDSIEILAQPLACFDAAGLSVELNQVALSPSAFALDNTSTSLALPARDIFLQLATLGLPVSECQMAVWLQVRSSFESSGPDQSDVRVNILTYSEKTLLNIIDLGMDALFTGTAQGIRP